MPCPQREMVVSSSCNDGSDAENLLRLVEQHQISHLHMVPTMFARLLRAPDEVKRQMIDWWGPVINEYCGGTESGGVVFHTAEEASRNPGTVGRPIVGGAVTIFDGQGRELPSNTVGDVYMRLTGLADFTYNGMDHKRRKIERDGLMTCGDVGHLGDDGYLVLCDRRHDMVITGRVNIYRAEIEAVHITVPGSRDCAVFGIPDEEYGELLCTCLETPSGTPVSAEAGRDFLRPHLASYKIPKRIECQSRVRIPARIFKRKLRDQYWETQRRQI